MKGESMDHTKMQYLQTKNLDVDMSKSEAKTKVIIYYWQNTNLHLGHIACVLKELDGQNRELYISPGIDPSYEQDPNQLQELLEDEIKFFKSNSVVKMELPGSSTTLDQFLEEFPKNAKSNIDEGYSVVSRNCAHLVSKVLSTVYGTKPNLSWWLLPRTVVKDACKLYGCDAGKNLKIVQDLSDIEPTNDSKFTEGIISRISKYQFAKLSVGPMLGTLFGKVQNLYNNGKITYEAIIAFQDAKDDFLRILRSSDINDPEVTKAFTVLAENIAVIGKTLQDDDLKSFKEGASGLSKSIKRVLKDKDLEAYKCCTSAAYELSRIISEDPKLESFREFKLAVKKVANFTKLNSSHSDHKVIDPTFIV
jgi:hypothetical protein